MTLALKKNEISMIKTIEELSNCIEIPLSNLEKDYAIFKGFPLKVPFHFASKIEKKSIHDPILKQILPLKLELNNEAGFNMDPVGDQNSLNKPCIIQKYKSRALIILTGQCAVHCRYCFRRHFPYQEAQFHKHSLEEIKDYFESNTAINEVIFSGGDPFSLHEMTLAEIIKTLEKIRHIKTIRFHTRIPIVDPKRITRNFIKMISSNRFKKVLVVHCNHPNELCHDVKELMLEFKNNDFTLLNQAVLLKGINDDLASLTALSEKLFEANILPYYLNQLDKVQGSAHFYVSDERGKELILELQKRLSGYLVPNFVQERAGEKNKVRII